MKTTMNEAVENFSKNCIEMKDLPVGNSTIIEGFLLSQGPSPKHSISLKQLNVAKGLDASTSRFLVWTMTKNADSGEENNFYFEYKKEGNSTFQTSSVLESIIADFTLMVIIITRNYIFDTGNSLIEARSLQFRRLISSLRKSPLNVDLILCNFGLPEFARY